MAEFIVAGEFKIPFENKAGGKKLLVGDFWDSNSELELVQVNSGVYIFCARVGRNCNPIYVGKATQTFEQECFTFANLKKYYEGLLEYKKCTPVMFFVTHPSQRGKTNKKEIDEIENFMIQICAEINPELQNVKKKKAPSWVIKGVIRGKRGQPTASEKRFRKMLNM